MTTDRTKRRVRWTAIGGTALVGVGAAVAIGANPRPHSERPQAPDVQALQAREQALALQAQRVNAMNSQRWAVYRQELAARQAQIDAVNLANQRARAASAAASTASSGGSYGGSSYSAPSATYVPSPPVASSGAS